MGTLGQYLRSAREARGIDLHEAAQQTRIGITYLKALEEEDFSRLPGEVFVRGFLKNYGKYLQLEESQVMRKYAESRAPKSEAGPVAAVAEKEPPAIAGIEHERKTPRSTTIETFIWGAAILIALILFLFTSLPGHRHQEAKHVVAPLSTQQTATAQSPVMQLGKLYLEVVALEDTWLLVRTDNSPQKKALLKKGESLIWSADERFLLSYGSAKSLKLMLNGQELIVNEPGNEVVRDMAITASGIVSSKLKMENKGPQKKRLAAEQQQQPSQKVIGPQLPTTTTKTQPPPLAGSPAPLTKQTPTQTRR
jgi:transcriptional regulator with XRE-family HTH domain